MRDLKKSQDYWSLSIADLAEVTGDSYRFLLDSSISYDQRIGEYHSLDSYSFDITSALYSSGAPIPECISAARHLLLDAYPKFVAVCREDAAYAHGAYGGGWDFRTRYLALAVLSCLTPDESRPLVEAVDFWPDRDALWERFIALLGHGAGRPEVKTLVWPEAYASLLEATDPHGNDLTRLAALRIFTKDWLKNMRVSTNPFYSNENNPNNTYVGHWCFEAAAIAVAFGIDDSIIRDHPHYPKDWADWARGCRPVA